MKKRWYFGSRAIAPSTYYVTTGEHPQPESEARGHEHALY